jgi:hypothetical protein
LPFLTVFCDCVLFNINGYVETREMKYTGMQLRVD